MAAIENAPAVQPSPSGNSSRRKRKRNDADLDEAERARRQLQRQKQDLAIKLRAEGKVYKPQKAKKSNLKADKGSLPGNNTARTKQIPDQQQHQQAVPQREETGTRPDGDVQVIIVPIFWNKRADEKDTVVSIAEEVRDQLQEQGISAGLDTTNADTPGQKYRYWEQKGVKVRVELGPRDAQKSQACLAISTTPGEMAKKTTYQIGAELSKAVQRALAASGNGSAPAEQQKADPSQTAGKQQKVSKHNQHFPDVNTEPPAGVVEKPTILRKQPGLLQRRAKDSKNHSMAKSALPSGDDLGDEFAIEIDAEEDSGAKKKNKPADTSVSDIAEAGRTKTKKNKHKIVQF